MAANDIPEDGIAAFKQMYNNAAKPAKPGFRSGGNEMKRLVGALALAVALGGCGNGGEAPAPAGTAGTGSGAEHLSESVTVEDFRPELPLKEVMGHVIDNAADGIWLHQGWTVTEAGEEDLFPKTDAEWLATENAALTLAEVSNSLLLPGRPQDEDRAWVDYVHRLHDAAIKTHEAAEAKDKNAFFDAGGEIYVVCRDCHQRYILGEIVPPSK